MEQFTATLKRKVGPFPIGVWLIIIVVGVGLGLLLRRRFSSSEPGDDGSGMVEPSDPQSTALGLSGPVSGGAAPGNAPVTITRTELVETVDREVLDDLFGRLEGIQGDIAELPRVQQVGTDDPSTPDPDPDPAPSQPSGSKSKPVDPLQQYRAAVISAYQTEGVDPPNTGTIARIALEVQQGRSIQDLRRSIRNNEKRQGRRTVAESRAYWSKKTDKAGVPGV